MRSQPTGLNNSHIGIGIGNFGVCLNWVERRKYSGSRQVRCSMIFFVIVCGSWILNNCQDFVYATVVGKSLVLEQLLLIQPNTVL